MTHTKVLLFPDLCFSTMGLLISSVSYNSQKKIRFMCNHTLYIIESSPTGESFSFDEDDKWIFCLEFCPFDEFSTDQLLIPYNSKLVFPLFPTYFYVGAV